MRGRTVVVVLVAALVTPSHGLPRHDLRWHEVTTEHFALLSSASPDHTQEIAETLEAFRATLLGLMPAAGHAETSWTRVFVFGSRETFRPYDLRTPAGEPRETGGYCIRSPAGYFIGIDATPGYVYKPVIYHEYVHQLMFTRHPGLPLWLHEGIAEYFSTLVVVDGHVRAGYPPQQHLDWLHDHPMPSLPSLFTMSGESAGYHEKERSGAFYAGSWVFTHYLLHDGGGTPLTLQRILTLSSPERPFHETLQAELGVKDLQTAVQAYAARRTFAARTLAAAPAPDPGRYKAMTVSRETALTRLGELLAFAIADYPDAEAHFRAALAADQMPRDAAIGLGYALELLGRADESAKWFDAAIEMAPEDPRAFQLRGRAVLSAFEASLPSSYELGDLPDPRVLAAREAFRRCTQLGPENAACQAGVGMTYRYEPGDVSEGIAALERACALRPDDEEAAANLAVLYAREGRIEQAERLTAFVEGATRRVELFRATRRAVSAAERAFVQRLANDGKVDEAKALLARMIAGTTDLRARRELTAELQAVDHYGRYVEAVRLANEGKLAEAISLLTVLDAEEGYPEIQVHVRDLLERLRARAAE